MSDTPNIALPKMLANLFQKELTYNEAMLLLDVLVQAAVLDKDLTAPPGSPADGDRYIVGPGATGAWAGHEDDIAYYATNTWQFITPNEGFVFYVSDETLNYQYAGASDGWQTYSGAVFQPLDADLTDIAALTTTVYGRSFLTLANAVAGADLIDLGTSDSPTFAGLTVNGNFTVTGSTTSINVTNLDVDDPLIKLADGNVANAVDTGYYSQYQPAGTVLYSGLFRDASDSNKHKLFNSLQEAPTTTVNTAGTGYTMGTLVANLEGATASLTGLLTVGAGSAAAPAIVSTTGTADTGPYFPGADSYAVATGGVIAFAADSAQHFGIGTATPSAILQILGTAYSGTPSSGGQTFRSSGLTFTDSNTAISGTAAAATFNSFGQPTLVATNATVTTTLAATVSILGPPIAGANETLTTSVALTIGGASLAGAGTAITAMTLRVLTVQGATNNYCAEFVNSTGSTTASQIRLKSANAAIVNGDVLGGIDFVSDDTQITGTVGNVTARIYAAANQTHNSTANGTRIIIAPCANTEATPVEIARFINSAVQVNSFQFTGAATGVGPAISAIGETNVDLNLAAKGIGAVISSSTVKLRAGTATAGTAPLLFVSGTNLTTAVAGTMEYDGTDVMFTRSGTTREKFMFVECFTYACSDETTAIAVGTGKITFRAPYAATVVAVRASVTTAPTGANLIIDINEAGTTILSTKLSIDATEKTSTTAASAAVVSDAALADDAEMSIDFDQVGSTIAGAGVKVEIYLRRA